LPNRAGLANNTSMLPTISGPTSRYTARQTPATPTTVRSNAAHLLMDEILMKNVEAWWPTVRKTPRR
jgi:hypothetical protein